MHRATGVRTAGRVARLRMERPSFEDRAAASEATAAPSSSSLQLEFVFAVLRRPVLLTVPPQKSAPG